MYSLFIAEDNSEETSFKCVAQNKPEPSGKFQWTIGGEIVKSASDPDEITATGDEISTFIYTPKVLNTIFSEIRVRTPDRSANKRSVFFAENQFNSHVLTLNSEKN